MTLNSKEHIEIMKAFEASRLGNRYDVEARELQEKGYIYQCGETNNLFIAFRHGYARGRAEYLSE